MGFCQGSHVRGSFLPEILKKAGFNDMQLMAIKTGVQIVRQLIQDGIMSKYRLAKEMGVSEEAIDGWMDNRWFNEAVRLPRLLEVREKYLRMKGLGIYSREY